MIFLKMWRIVGDLPLFGDSIFRTLIADGDAHFRHHFSPLLAYLFWFRNVARSYSRLASEKGPFLETDELPVISLKYRRILGNLPLFEEALVCALITDGDAPFPGPFWPSPRGPVSVPKLGLFLSAIIYRKVPFSETD